MEGENLEEKRSTFRVDATCFVRLTTRIRGAAQTHKQRMLSTAYSISFMAASSTSESVGLACLSGDRFFCRIENGYNRLLVFGIEIQE